MSDAPARRMAGQRTELDELIATLPRRPLGIYAGGRAGAVEPRRRPAQGRTRPRRRRALRRAAERRAHDAHPQAGPRRWRLPGDRRQRVLLHDAGRTMRALVAQRRTGCTSPSAGAWSSSGSIATSRHRRSGASTRRTCARHSASLPDFKYQKPDWRIPSFAAWRDAARPSTAPGPARPTCASRMPRCSTSSSATPMPMPRTSRSSTATTGASGSRPVRHRLDSRVSGRRADPRPRHRRRVRPGQGGRH